MYGLVLKTDSASESVAAFWRSLAGGKPERTGRYSVGVGFRYPVTVREASIIVCQAGVYVHCNSILLRITARWSRQGPGW